MFETLGGIWLSLWNSFGNIASFLTYEVIDGYSIFEMIFGAGLSVFVTYTIVKWVTDIL